MDRNVILHCSDSAFGNAVMINDWHTSGNGWDMIGYHFVIQNGTPFKGKYIEYLDGMVEVGRSLDKLGAHAVGHNDAIGICFIGEDSFTVAQMMSARRLLKELGIKSENVLGHYDVSSKTCPNFNVEDFRKFMDGELDALSIEMGEREY